ncbi:hypothetical protein OPV22_010620 [Ensete ventricosum]|uniref:Uncharacterized protein n=1 Tax=Ensete ventricosum TaxID=4639 RepID=A0AAV8RLK6_ENSVE|nr:hypothetical protein OPV22_010620 [Ensete ventricosum]
MVRRAAHRFRVGEGAELGGFALRSREVSASSSCHVQSSSRNPPEKLALPRRQDETCLQVLRMLGVSICSSSCLFYAVIDQWQVLILGSPLATVPSFFVQAAMSSKPEVRTCTA